MTIKSIFIEILKSTFWAGTIALLVEYEKYSLAAFFSFIMISLPIGFISLNLMVLTKLELTKR